jgi:hypothetical protein
MKPQSARNDVDVSQNPWNCTVKARRIIQKKEKKVNLYNPALAEIRGISRKFSSEVLDIAVDMDSTIGR